MQKARPTKTHKKQQEAHQENTQSKTIKNKNKRNTQQTIKNMNTKRKGLGTTEALTNSHARCSQGLH